MALTICTTFGPRGYKEYGARFLESFDKHWPSDTRLIVYTEEPVEVPRGEQRDFWGIPGAVEFADRHKSDLSVQGRTPAAKWDDREKNRFANAGRKGVQFYTYRYDALKFFCQCLVPEDASLDLADGDLLAWFDADVVAFADVPGDLVERMMADRKTDFDLCYLGRRKLRHDGDPDKLGGAASEIGFWAVRINSKTREFLRRFADAWRNDTFKRYAEWHSAYVFDCTRLETERLVQMKSRNLTNGPRGSEGGHVWHSQASPLRLYMDHLKGARKTLDRSPEARNR